MPSVFTDEKGTRDLIIGNQTGITFGVTCPNGDPIATNVNNVAQGVNLASVSLGSPFPSAYTLPSDGVTRRALIFMGNCGASGGSSPKQQAIIGVRDAAVPSWWMWRLRMESKDASDFYAAMWVGYTDDTFKGWNESKIWEPNGGWGSSDGFYTLSFGMSSSLGSSPPKGYLIYELRKTNATTDTVIASGNTTILAYGYYGYQGTANMEFVVSLFNGNNTQATGSLGKVAYLTTPPTYAERRALALSMFAI